MKIEIIQNRECTYNFEYILWNPGLYYCKNDDIYVFNTGYKHIDDSYSIINFHHDNMCVNKGTWDYAIFTKIENAKITIEV